MSSPVWKTMALSLSIIAISGMPALAQSWSSSSSVANTPTGIPPSTATPVQAAPSSIPWPDKKPDKRTMKEADKKPAPPPKPMAKPTADMQRVLNTLEGLGPKPLESLTPEEARKQPGPADAVKYLMAKEKKAQPPNKLMIQDSSYIATTGSLPVRIYSPEKTDPKKPLPVIVYYHGGGWVLANIDTYDASARALAEMTHAIVIAPDYRHAPENKFPAAHEDAFAAYQWVLSNAATFNGDPTRIALVGESAGGNLAANVSLMARDQKVQMPVYQVLIYPIASNDMNSPSYQENALAKPLNKAMMQWFFQQTLRTPEDAKNPKINLLSADLKGLPPTTIINAQIDPLRSEGELLAKMMKAAGVDTTQKTYEGVTHEFFGMGAVIPEAKDAEKMSSDALTKAFKQAKKDNKAMGK